MTALTVRVFGRPAPEGSHEVGEHGYVKHSSRYLEAWRHAVNRDTRKAYLGADLTGRDMPVFPYPAPVYIYAMTIVVDDEQCRAAGTAEPTGSPDLDKLVRATIDGLGDARVFGNDSQIVEIWNVSKRRAVGTEAAGAFITITDQPYLFPQVTHEREETPMALTPTGKYRLTLAEVLVDEEGDEINEDVFSVRDTVERITDCWLPSLGMSLAPSSPTPELPSLPPGGPQPTEQEGNFGAGQPKRRRRTKEQIAADSAAAAAGVNQRPDNDVPDETVTPAEAAPYNPFTSPQA